MTDSLIISQDGQAGLATYPAGATYGPRAGRDFEFVWIIEGDAIYRYDQNEIPLGPDSLLLCRPGWTDFFQWDVNRRTRHAFFHFQILSIPPDFLAIDQWPIVRELAGDDVIRPLFRHLLAWQGRADDLLRELTMKAILTAFVTGQIAAGDLPPDLLPDPVESAWNHLHKRLEDDPAARIGLAELADIAAVTPEHLCRLFKKSIGHTPVETVLLARLDRASSLVARSNYAIGEIAEMCGFASPFHFSRRFRDAFGQSPMQLRQSIRRGLTPPTPRLLRVHQPAWMAGGAPQTHPLRSS